MAEPKKRAKPRKKRIRRVDKNPKVKFASGFEQRTAKDLTSRGVDYKYEPLAFEYYQVRTYTPDFVLPNGIIVETKGKFVGQDRTKHLLVRKQHPDYDIRIVFMQNNLLRKNSKTRYGDWCDRNGIKWALGKVPEEWINEPPVR